MHLSQSPAISWVCGCMASPASRWGLCAIGIDIGAAENIVLGHVALASDEAESDRSAPVLRRTGSPRRPVHLPPLKIRRALRQRGVCSFPTHSHAFRQERLLDGVAQISAQNLGRPCVPSFQGKLIG